MSDPIRREPTPLFETLSPWQDRAIQSITEDMESRLRPAARLGVTPFQQTMLRSGGANMGLGMIAALGEEGVKALFGVAPTPDVTDPTDPGVLPEGESETGTRVIRAMRRLARATAYSTETGLPLHFGINRAIEQGELAPATTTEEKFIDFAAPILATLGLFGVASGLAGAAMLAIEGSAANALTGGALAHAAATPVAPVLGAVAARLPGVRALVGVGDELGQAAGAAGKRMGGYAPGAGFLRRAINPRISTAQLTDALGALMIDTGFGALAGTADIAARAASGEELDAATAATILGANTAFGAILGAAFRAPTIWNTSLGWRNLKNFRNIRDAELPTGTPVGDLVYRPTDGRGSPWVWKPGHVIDGVNVGGRKAPGSELDPALLYEAKRANVFKLEQQVPGDVATAVAAADPQAPQTLPPDIQPEYPRISLMAGDLSNNESFKRAVARLGTERLESQVDLLNEQMFDGTLPLEQRVAATTRWLAVKNTLGDLPPTPAGATTLDVDAAAAALWRNTVPSMGTEGIGGLIARGEALIAVGQRELGERVVQLANDFRDTLPKVNHTAVLRALQKSSNAASRGFDTGSRVLTKNGEIFLLRERPVYGRAKAEKLGPERSTTLELLKIDDVAMPLPRTNQIVEAADGRLINVKSVNETEASVTGISLLDNQEVTIPLTQVAKIGQNIGAFRNHESQRAILARLLTETDASPTAVQAARESFVEAQGIDGYLASWKAVKSSDVTELGSPVLMEAADAYGKGKIKTFQQFVDFLHAWKEGERPVPIFDATTSAGEVVRVESLGPESATIVSKTTGARKAVRRSALRPSTRNKAAWDPHETVREVVDFAPGTLPAEGNKLLFIAVPRETGPALEDAWRTGRVPDVDAFVQQNGVHALPPVEPQPGYVLYGVEIPRATAPLSKYTPEAKAALAALKGTGRVGNYSSRVNIDGQAVAQGRIYRVPDALHAATQRSVRELQAMSQVELTSYLRNLINLNETISTPLAEAAAARRAALESARKALTKKDYRELMVAEDARAAAEVETSRAANEVRAEIERPMAQRIIDTVAPMDPDGALQVEFALRGLPKGDRQRMTVEELRLLHFWENKLESLDVLDHNTPREALTLLHDTEPGQELRIIRKKASVTEQVRVNPEVPVTQARTRIIDQWRAEPTINGRVIKEDIQTFESVADLTKYVQERGYIPSTLSTWEPQYRGPNGLVVRVTRVPEGLHLRGEVETGTPITRADRLRATFGMEVDTEAGIRIEVKHDVTFSSQEALDRFMREHRIFREGAAKSAYEEFLELPKLEDVRELGVHKEAVKRSQTLLDRYEKSALPVPEYLIDYASELAMVYRERTGHAAFTKETRELIGAPTALDLAQPSIHSISYEEGGSYINKGRRGDSPSMHVSAQRRIVLLRDYVALPARVQGVEVTQPGAAVRAAAEAREKQVMQSRWIAAWLAQAENITGEINTLTRVQVVRHTPTGRVGVIDGPVSLVEKEVRLRFPEGDDLTVAKSDVEQASTYDPAGDGDYRWADYAGGQVDDAVQRLERESQLGQLLEERVTAVRALASEITLNPNGTVDIPAPTFKQLMDIYRWGQWRNVTKFETGGKELGEAAVFLGEAATRGREFAKIIPMRSITDVIEEEIRKVGGEPMLAGFKRAVEDHWTEALGGSPFNIALAKSFAGTLSPAAETQIRALAQQFNISQNMPLAVMFKELMLRKVIDPYGAQIGVELADASKLVGWLQTNIGEKGAVSFGSPLRAEVQLKIRSPLGDMPRFAGINIPWKVMRRQPLARLVSDAVWDALEVERRTIHLKSTEFLHSLYNLKLNEEEVGRVFKAIGDPAADTFDDAVKAGLLPAEDKFAAAFGEARAALEDLRYMAVRNLMRQSMTPIEADLTNEVHRSALRAVGLEADAIAAQGKGRGTFLASPTLEMLKGAPVASRASLRTKFTENQIQLFIEALKTFDDAAKVPESMVARLVSPTFTAESFQRYFTFWKKWGIKNYFPLVHEGNMAIIVKEADGAERIVGWATHFGDIIDQLDELIRRGSLRWENGELLDNITIKHTKTNLVDDIISSHTPNYFEYKKWLGEVIKGIDGMDVRALVMRFPAESPGMVKNATFVHGKPRDVGLVPVLDDPIRAFQVYVARAARNEYRWRVREAYRTLHDKTLDGALSRYQHTPTLHATQDESGMTGLYEYILDYLHHALGERGRFERWLDNVTLPFMTMVREGVPKATAKALGENVPTSYGQLLTRNNWYRPYAARQRAGDWVSFQSKWRLAGSLGSAFVNATQVLSTTGPALAREFGIKDGYGALWSAMGDAYEIATLRSFGKQIPSRLRASAEVVDGTGSDLMPAKYEFGAQGESFSAAGGPPLARGGRAERYARNFAYWTMMPFNTAETANRAATALAAYRLARNVKKFDHGTAIQYARRVVRETQFQYDELAMPQLLAAGGPLMRVLFQFKPFLINMASFELEAMNGMWQGIRTGQGLGKVVNPASKQVLAHAGALLALGGMAGLAYNPLAQLVTAPLRMVIDEEGSGLLHDIAYGPERGIADWQQRRWRGMTPEQRYSQSVPFRWDDILHYGIPGAVGFSLGQRVGISGQDFTIPTSIPDALGPHLSVYGEIANAWSKYAGIEGSGTGAAVGAAAYGALLAIPEITRAGGAVRAITQNAQWFARLPYFKELAATTVAAVASPQARGYFTQSKEAIEAARRLMPAEVARIQASIQLGTSGAFTSASGQPTPVPRGSRLFEGAANILNLPTIRREEERAYNSFLSTNSAGRRDARAEYTSRIANYVLDGDMGKAYEVMFEAGRAGIELDEEAIQRRIDALTAPRTEQTRLRLNRNDRDR